MRFAGWVAVAVCTGCGGSAPPPQPVAPVVAVPDQSAVAEDADAGAEAEWKLEVPDGYTEVIVAGVAPTGQGNAVLLVDETRNAGVPVFIGDTEALSIQLRLRDRSYARPLTHDLLDRVVRRLDARIVAVRVDALIDSVFHGTVMLRHEGETIEIDSRVSDAVALAVGNRVPIFMSLKVLSAAAMDINQFGQPPPEPDEPLGAPP